MNVGIKLPAYVKRYFNDIDTSKDDAPIYCASCKEISQTCHEATTGYNSGECLILTCYNTRCSTKRKWAYCKTCEERVDAKWAIKGHHRTAKHQKKAQAIIDGLVSDAGVEQPSSSKRTHNEMQGTDGGSTDNDEAFSGVRIMDEEFSKNDDQPPKESEPTKPLRPGIEYPSRKAIEQNNDWLVAMKKGGKKATQNEIREVFKDNANMRYFFSAEHETPNGRAGASICYTVARAFQKTELIEDLPSFEEAKFQ